MAKLIDADKLIKEITIAQETLQTSDDKQWERNKKYFKGLAWAHKIVLEQPTIEAEPKWIPCSARLPEENKEVLIQIWYGTMTVGCLSDNRWISEAWPYQIHEVAAWMPLPEPYKGEEK